MSTESSATPPREEIHPPEVRRAQVERDEHATILQKLGLVDWLVLLLVAAYVLAVQVEPPHPEFLVLSVAVFAAFLVVLRWRRFPVKKAPARIALVAAVMVAFISVVVLQTGGANSPLVNLYLLPIVLVAMTLGSVATLVVFIGVALVYSSVIIGSGALPPIGPLLARLFGELAPFALVAYLTQALTGSIVTARRRIEAMAERDGLTGLLNLRTFRSLLEREHLIRARAGRGGYGLLMVDVDQLKAINDTHGHQAGNVALTTVSAAIQRAIRSTDVAARYGGDEFIIFLPDASPEVSEAVAQRVRNNVYKSMFPVGGRLQRISVSVGAAAYPRDGQVPEDIVRVADQKMYRDKELRRRNAEGGAAGVARPEPAKAAREPRKEESR